MSKIKLGVNIDHVATVRNARGENYPDPLQAAMLAQKYGADSITIHLREDRRHINDSDLKKINSKLKIPLNLEMAPTKEMLKIALKENPDYVCLVPENRKEITTEGGLNLDHNKELLKKIIFKLKKKKIRVSLFIEPNQNDIIKAKFFYNSDCIEIHSGKICRLIDRNKKYNKELKKIRNAINMAHIIGLEAHVGHGLNFKSAKIISKLKHIKEFNIGHFLIGNSIFNGFRYTINKFKKIIK
tara:strand:+ start:670 stop:1395 length:726 start_codon:yes stop_codon:yes gene_type:complete